MYKDFSISGFLIGLVQVITTIVEFFIVFRIILKLFGANPNTPFVTWIYETTRGLIAPFAGMFPSPVLDGGFVIEFSSIFALVIYALLGYFLVELILYVNYSSTSRYSVRSEKTTVRR